MDECFYDLVHARLSDGVRICNIMMSKQNKWHKNWGEEVPYYI
jgi:hypothetical protein